MENEALVKNDYLQMMPIDQAKQNYGLFGEFVKSILKEDLDYGVIPGTQKKSLYKAGAEKLRFVYGIGIEIEPIEAIVDNENLVVDYTYRCTARSRTGQILAQCEGNCNSAEAKFGYVWKEERDLPDGVNKDKLISRKSGKKMSEFDFAITKGETTGQYGKPAEYWKMWKDAQVSGRAKPVSRKTKKGSNMEAWEIDEEVVQYRIKNPDVVGLKNTIMKMAQKRAFVGAILLATGASEWFTQDIEDMDITGTGYIHSDEPTYTPYEEVKPEWFFEVEACTTPAEVDLVAIKYKDEILADAGIRKMVNTFKLNLKNEVK